MGEFIALSGVIESDKGRVQDALRKYALARRGVFEANAGTTDDTPVLVITDGPGGVTVMYPDDFVEWDEASAFISGELNAPVFSLHIHDGDLWMFVLNQGQREVAHFNPIPDYWEEHLSAEEYDLWKGDAQTVASHVPGLQAENIERYFVRWQFDEDAEPEKAYADDQFNREDCWQLCDFMKRVGLEYPVDETGTLSGETFRFSVSKPL